MKLPWQKADSAELSGPDAAAERGTDPAADGTHPARPAQTAGKGRPTPTRREAEGRKRGPIAPAPQTRSEARQRRKDLANSMSKEEKKAASAQRRSAASERRELMMQGDERYLPVRDRGPEKALARDLVDAKRHLSTMFIPFAIVVMVFVFATTGNPSLSGLGTVALLLMVVVMAIEGFFTGRRVNKRVREKYPNSTETGFRLGFYAFMRSTQLRRMRVPRPQRQPGDLV